MEAVQPSSSFAWPLNTPPASFQAQNIATIDNVNTEASVYEMVHISLQMIQLMVYWRVPLMCSGRYTTVLCTIGPTGSRKTLAKRSESCSLEEKSVTPMTSPLDGLGQHM